MNIAANPKSVEAGALSSTAAATDPAASIGTLTIDLDALIANWRKLEKTAMPGRMRRRGEGRRLWLRRRSR